jgi:AcrR family transcriptional regulator
MWRRQAVSKVVGTKREVILQAAGKVFAERGYHATGIADIAREIGAGHGTFYRYFKNKEDIARSLVSHVFGQVMGALADEDPQASTTLAQYRAQVRRIGDKLFNLVIAEPALCQILFYDAVAIDRADREVFATVLDASGAYTAAFISNGQDRGFLRDDVDAQVIGLAINGMILAGAARLLHSRDPQRMREPWIRAIETLMFEGLGG